MNSKRSRTIAAPIYHRIDAMNLYAAQLFKPDELCMPPDRLGLYYNRTGKHLIKWHIVRDGVLVVRVE